MKMGNITDEEMDLVMDVCDNHEEEFKAWADEHEDYLMKWYDENELQGIFDCRFAAYCSKKFMEFKKGNN